MTMAGAAKERRGPATVPPMVQKARGATEAQEKEKVRAKVRAKGQARARARARAEGGALTRPEPGSTWFLSSPLHSFPFLMIHCRSYHPYVYKF